MFKNARKALRQRANLQWTHLTADPFAPDTQILHLEGLRYLFQLNIFLYCLAAFVLLTVIVLSITKAPKWRRRKAGEEYAT